MRHPPLMERMRASNAVKDIAAPTSGSRARVESSVLFKDLNLDPRCWNLSRGRHYVHAMFMTMRFPASTPAQASVLTQDGALRQQRRPAIAGIGAVRVGQVVLFHDHFAGAISLRDED